MMRNAEQGLGSTESEGYIGSLVTLLRPSPHGTPSHTTPWSQRGGGLQTSWSSTPAAASSPSAGSASAKRATAALCTATSPHRSTAGRWGLTSASRPPVSYPLRLSTCPCIGPCVTTLTALIRHRSPFVAAISYQCSLAALKSMLSTCNIPHTSHQYFRHQ